MKACIRLAFVLIGTLWVGLAVLSIVPPPTPPVAPSMAAPSAIGPELPGTCTFTGLFPSVALCSDGRIFRFDWDAVRDFLEPPRVRFLAGR